MKIGDVELEAPVLLAPMAGVTDLPYRRLVKEMGCPLVCTEMVSAKGLAYGNKKTERMLEILPVERPVSLQLFGNEPDILAKATQMVVEKSSPEIIDLNVGCPAPKIVKNGYGSALMKEPKLLGEVVKAMVEATDTTITVKIRKGWDDNNINAVEIAKIAQDNGAKAIIVHGRTREEFYTGKADWDIIRRVKESLEIPIIGNGDIFTLDDGVRMLKETGCDGVMVGRGAQGNPWLINQIAQYLKTGDKLDPPSAQERLDTAIKHLSYLVQYKGEPVGVKEMRKHASWYIKGLKNCTYAKDLLNKAETLDGMKNILEEYKDSLTDAH
ncbi:tRNA dihydrouridine synthase DusB [Halonatronum saccharophilum]|uniref:tRNA dihydrouridine synthase DusB n=1 Tax=Halonatronum saccharophilum TaxID=150060 RepID=UPI0004848706